MFQTSKAQVSFNYNGKMRIVEVQMFKTTKEGHKILIAKENGLFKSFRTDKIAHIWEVR